MHDGNGDSGCDNDDGHTGDDESDVRGGLMASSSFFDGGNNGCHKTISPPR